ncbi:Hypothetical protein RY69_209 [Bifidobacterium breve]|nr:Hypothetical protein RY69_209 [Bifidobacterium breve]
MHLKLTISEQALQLRCSQHCPSSLPIYFFSDISLLEWLQVSKNNTIQVQHDSE